MQTKKKICAGWDGNEHEAYIYKNIDRKKYCRACAYKLQPPVGIKAVSPKYKFKLQLKKDLVVEDQKMYLEIWDERFGYDSIRGYWIVPKCENCKKSIGNEPLSIFFHHILEKRNFPEWRHVKKNIAILCSDCHSGYEAFPSKFPQLVDRRSKLMKEYFEEIGTKNQ